MKMFRYFTVALVASMLALTYVSGYALINNNEQSAQISGVPMTAMGGQGQQPNGPMGQQQSQQSGQQVTQINNQEASKKVGSSPGDKPNSSARSYSLVYEQPIMPVYPQPTYEMPVQQTYQVPSYQPPAVTYEQPIVQTYQQPIVQSYQQPSYQQPSYQVQNYTTPSYSAPTYTAPTYQQQPSYQQTSYQVQNYTTPSYSAPAYTPPTTTYSAPTYSTPTYSTPTYSTPTYSTPTYSTPTYSTPTYSTPTYSTPTYSTPTYQTTNYTTTTYQQPSYTQTYSPPPTYTAPTYTTPTYQTTNYTVPTQTYSPPPTYQQQSYVAPTYSAPVYEQPIVQNYTTPSYEMPTYQQQSYVAPVQTTYQQTSYVAPVQTYVAPVQTYQQQQSYVAPVQTTYQQTSYVAPVQTYQQQPIYPQPQYQGTALLKRQLNSSSSLNETSTESSLAVDGQGVQNESMQSSDSQLAATYLPPPAQYGAQQLQQKVVQVQVPVQQALVYQPQQPIFKYLDTQPEFTQAWADFYQPPGFLPQAYRTTYVPLVQQQKQYGGQIQQPISPQTLGFGYIHWSGPINPLSLYQPIAQLPYYYRTPPMSPVFWLAHYYQQPQPVYQGNKPLITTTKGAFAKRSLIPGAHDSAPYNLLVDHLSAAASESNSSTMAFECPSKPADYQCPTVLPRTISKDELKKKLCDYESVIFATLNVVSDTDKSQTHCGSLKGVQHLIKDTTSDVNSQLLPETLAVIFGKDCLSLKPLISQTSNEVLVLNKQMLNTTDKVLVADQTCDILDYSQQLTKDELSSILKSCPASGNKKNYQ